MKGLSFIVIIAAAQAMSLRRSAKVVAREKSCVVSNIGDMCAANDGPFPHCLPYRSPESCADNLSFPSLIAKRTEYIKSNGAALEEDGWWFHRLEQDKLAGYVYAASSNYNAPEVYFCSSSNVSDSLDDFEPPAVGTGFVIRTTHLHSNEGVYVLPTGFGGMEKIRAEPMSLTAVKDDLRLSGATKIVIEEYVSGPNDELPTEYKFHMFNGIVGSINIVYGRGTPCNCWAEIDELGERLDQHGCFVPNLSNQTFGTCGHIDFKEGSKHPYPVKGMQMCSTIPELEPCLMNDMLEIARNASKEIGVYVRVDMFVDQNRTVYLNEISTNHLNGLKHCSARLMNDTNCVDSCFLGEMWRETAIDGGNFTLGGSLMPHPHSDLSRFLLLDQEDNARCEMVSSIKPNRTESSCSPVQLAGSDATSVTIINVTAGEKIDVAPPMQTDAPPGLVRPSPPTSMCPAEIPSNGESCGLPGPLECLYDEICCPDGSCEFASCCKCVDGKFECEVEKEEAYCPAICPPQYPDGGDICSITKYAFHCPYNEHCCDDGLCFISIVCSCDAGSFMCNHLNTTSICNFFP